MGRTAKGHSDREIAKTIAQQLPDVEVSHHHNTTEMRVHNKVFARLPARSKVIAVRCRAETLEILKTRYPIPFAAARAESWLEVPLDDIDAGTLQTLLIDSWLLAAPAAVRQLHENKLL